MTSERKSLLLSVGAMKAGTTWLFRHLASLPELEFTPEKELHFWSTTSGVLPGLLSPENRRRKLVHCIIGAGHGRVPDDATLAWYIRYANEQPVSLEWYCSLFGRKSSAKFWCDFSNLTAFLPRERWEVVLQEFPGTRVLYVMRDPVQRLWSHYRFQRNLDGLPSSPALVSLSEFREYVARSALDDNGRYELVVPRLEASIPAGQLFFGHFQEFREAPVESLNALAAFLGIAIPTWNVDELQKAVNSSPGSNRPVAWTEALYEQCQETYGFLDTRFPGLYTRPC